MNLNSILPLVCWRCTTAIHFPWRVPALSVGYIILWQRVRVPSSQLIPFAIVKNGIRCIVCYLTCFFTFSVVVCACVCTLAGFLYDHGYAYCNGTICICLEMIWEGAKACNLTHSASFGTGIHRFTWEIHFKLIPHGFSRTAKLSVDIKKYLLGLLFSIFHSVLLWNLVKSIHIYSEIHVW